jgi:hypothetical protein
MLMLPVSRAKLRPIMMVEVLRSLRMQTMCGILGSGGSTNAIF